MNVVDSSAWLEYFADGPNAEAFAGPIENIEKLILPTIIIFEVFKHILRQRGEDAALVVIAHMEQAEVVELDSTLAIEAARIGHDLKLPLADSIILATTQSKNAVLWTQDSDFEDFEGIKYYPRKND